MREPDAVEATRGSETMNGSPTNTQKGGDLIGCQ
jgi:hypothetical protein